MIGWTGDTWSHSLGVATHSTSLTDFLKANSSSTSNSKQTCRARLFKGDLGLCPANQPHPQPQYSWHPRKEKAPGHTVPEAGSEFSMLSVRRGQHAEWTPAPLHRPNTLHHSTMLAEPRPSPAGLSSACTKQDLVTRRCSALGVLAGAPNACLKKQLQPWTSKAWTHCKQSHCAC